MVDTYTKTYVGITHIMKLFNVGYSKAKVIFNDAREIQPKYYSSLENQVLLQKVLESQGIDFDFWSKQQEKRTKSSKGKSRR